jgi:hypothetical protein
VQTDKLVVFIYRSSMFVPRPLAVCDNMFLLNESRGEREGIFV